MQTTWFIVVSLMLATYVVLDGFDFGAGILHLFVAKKDDERRSVLAAIGPVWDGNEVWLLAGGGLLFFSFPRVYAAGFSGFYLPLTMVLWLLILRGISIEFRSMEASRLWRSFWDGVFFLSSSLMAIVLGAALGNVIRGVPLNAEGYFSGPLFTNFLPAGNVGVLDWYTVTVGLMAFAVLALHGALYLRMKTTGEVEARSSQLAFKLWIAVLVLAVVSTIATVVVRPSLYANLLSRPLGWVLSLAVVGSFAAILLTLKRPNQTTAFLTSCAFIASLLAATATGLYPVMLYSTISEANTLTIANSHAGRLSLNVGLYWWILAISIAIGYFVYLFSSFRGKVRLDEGYGH